MGSDNDMGYHAYGDEDTERSTEAQPLDQLAQGHVSGTVFYKLNIDLVSLWRSSFFLSQFRSAANSHIWKRPVPLDELVCQTCTIHALAAAVSPQSFLRSIRAAHEFQ